MVPKSIALFVLVLFHTLGHAQSKRNDIPVGQVPSEVRAVLEQYVQGLRSADNLEEAAQKFLAVAGGSLVNEQGKTLRSSTKRYGLKKDHQNIGFYANPIRITRVNLNPALRSSGYGPSAIRGNVYKIWIDKQKGQAGMPAPISILVPQGHAFVKKPKVVGIGSL